jgi:hypothetical protein
MVVSYKSNNNRGQDNLLNYKLAVELRGLLISFFIYTNSLVLYSSSAVV